LANLGAETADFLLLVTLTVVAFAGIELVLLDPFANRLLTGFELLGQLDDRASGFMQFDDLASKLLGIGLASL